jgi:hypothetical protein
MVKLPTYLSNTSVNNVGGGRSATAQDFGGDLGISGLARGVASKADAISQVSGVYQDISDRLQSYKNTIDQQEYSATMSVFELSTLERNKELSSQDYEPDVSLPATFSNDLMERAKALKIPNSMRAKFESDMQSLNYAVSQYGLEEQSRRTQLRVKNAYNTTLDSQLAIVGQYPDMRDSSLKRIEESIAALPGAEEYKLDLFSDSKQKIMETSAGAMVTMAPELFLQQQNNGQWDDLIESNKYVSAANSQIESNKKKQEKDLIASREASVLQKLSNEDSFNDKLLDDNITLAQKLVDINKLEVSGQVRKEFAAAARRQINSEKELNATTNSDTMAAITTRMYDLNAIADTNERDYLLGVNNIRADIMNKRAEGLLSADDQRRMNNQIKSLMSARIADATNDVTRSYGDARRQIEMQVPAEMRGDALRRLFYETETDRLEKELEGVSGRDARKQLKAIYGQKAKVIINDIKSNRRINAFESVPKIKSLEQGMQEINTPEVTELLSTFDYTMKDVEETARSNNMTPSEVIELLRNK